MQIRNAISRAWRWPLGLAAGFAAGAAITVAVPHVLASGATPVPATAVTAPAPAAVPVLSYADVVSRAVPAVVTVRIERKAEASPATAFENDPFFQRFFGGQPNGRNAPAPIERGLGSGVIVSPDGNILTNNHVVEHADHVTVTLADGREFTAKVVGTDPATDLAVAHIDATDLPTLPLGDSDRVRVGDVVLAVGNPLGVGQTVTMGIISGKGRTTPGDSQSYEDFLQTDAPINQGNSGGALITASGDLVGINSQIMSPSGGNIGIGFAIPSNMAKSVMAQLISTGHVRRAMLGVTVQPVTSDLAKSLNLPAVRGALINSVEPSGPAAKAGLQQGDVILKVNGTEVADANQLRNHISSMAPGASAALTIFRNGHDQQVNVTLAQLPDSGNAETPAAAADALGLTTEPLTPALAQQLGIPRGSEGLAVTDVDPSGAAAHAGVQRGDVIRQVNGEPVRSASDLRAALAKSARPALTLVQRGDHSLFVTLPAGRQ
jgi:serine protease Do